MLALLVLASQFADLPGVRIHFLDSGGEGAPIVFLHAATGSAESFELQFPAFTGFRAIAYDRRGSGKTAASLSPNPPPSAATDLDRLITHLGITRFHLVGTAAGGGVALDYALSFPSKLRSLTIANSLGGIADPSFAELGKILRPPQFAALPPDFRELSPSYRAANPAGVARWLAIEKAAHQAARPPAQPPLNRVTFQAIEAITTPTLLITGESDFYMPPAVLRVFKDRIKHAETLVLPEVGHSAYWEQPDLFSRAVLGFIRGR